MTSWATLALVFWSSFLAATVLPGGSEAVLFAALKRSPDLYWPALAFATAGNTLGGMTSYLIGRVLPSGERSHRALAWVRRHGSPVLLLAWAPVIGDALCVAAGWLRVNWIAAAAFMALGKLARYLVVAAAAG